MNELLNDLKEAEDSTDACVILLDYCFSEENTLSESQLGVLFQVFDESQIASYALMFLYSEMEDVDLLEFSEVYNVLYDKFLKSETPVSFKTNSIVA